MNDLLDIRVAQIRNQADAVGQAVADLVRDAYALGRLAGLKEGRLAGLTEANEAYLHGHRPPEPVDDVALRRPTTV